MSNFLGTLAITASKTTFDAPNDGAKAILIGNESGYTVIITMESGGVQKTLYPSTIDWFSVKKGFTGKILISPTVVLNNVSSFPASSLIFDAIGLYDSEDASQYPVVLPRNTNVGNTINTVGTTPTNVNNSGSNLGTRFIQAETSGDNTNQASAQLFNNGVLLLGQALLPLLVATRGAYLSILEFPADNSEVITGQTSGTVTVYQPLRGDLKLVIAVSNNYKNTGTQTVAIPVPFTSRYFFFVGDTGGATTHVGFLLNSVAQSMVVITTLNAAGGSATVQAFSAPNSFGESHAGCDTLQYLLNSGASNGIIVMVGA